jgi:iron-sulfur cluster repair protein YtfE (RIC family)
MSTDVDIIEFLERDHRRIDDLAAQLDSITDTDEISRLYVLIVDALLAHEAIEHEVLFPAFRALLTTAGDRILEHRMGEHEELNAMLVEMRELDPSGFAFIKRGSALLQEMEGHFAREEQSVFARMRAEMAHDELVDLGRRAIALKSASAT